MDGDCDEATYAQEGMKGSFFEENRVGSLADPKMVGEKRSNWWLEEWLWLVRGMERGFLLIWLGLSWFKVPAGAKEENAGLSNQMWAHGEKEGCA